MKLHALKGVAVTCAMLIAALVVPSPAHAATVPLDLQAILTPNYYAGLSVFNVYWDSTWDADHAGASMSTIDAATAALVSSTYPSSLTQYGVPATLGFGGSAAAVGFCGSQPGATTNTLSLLLFMACEEATPGTGVPFAVAAPFATTGTIYNLILPVGTNIVDTITNPFDGSVIFSNGSCNSGIIPVGGSIYGAYHALVPGLPIPIIPPRTIYFTIIPADCARTGGATGPLSVPKLMTLISHEVVEAATDPVPLAYWINLATATMPGGPGIFSALTMGEAADECQGLFGAVPFAPAGIPMTVNAYWSNAAHACMVGGSRVVSTTFSESGVPLSLASITVGGVSRSLSTGSLVEAELEGTSFAFPAEIDDGTGVRYIRGSCTPSATGTVTFPAGNTTGNPTETDSCSYSKEVLVTIGTDPAAAAIGNVTLTPSEWVTAGVAFTVHADTDVPAGAGSRYDFRGWSDGSVGFSTPTATYIETAPAQLVASYTLQHLVTFDQGGIPSGTAWHLTVAGVLALGPVSQWFDSGSSVSFSYEAVVQDSSSTTTRYVLSTTSPASPLSVSAPTTVIGSYGAQYLLHVGTSGLGTNTTTVSNGGTVLGTASDGSPVERWLPAGAVLDLHVDNPIDGAGGIEYFFNGFDPAPPATLTSGFSTTALYLTMAQQIDVDLSNGSITGAGLANSYKQQWAAVEADLAAGRFAPSALDVINAFVNHLQAQSGKKVTAATASQLELDAANVYLSVLCRAVAAGQVTPAQEATRYAWYVSLVTSLGVTPKPNC